MGSVAVRSITGALGMKPAPLLGGVTRDAGIIGGAMESYCEILRNTRLLMGKPGAGWVRYWGPGKDAPRKIQGNARILLGLSGDVEGISGADRILIGNQGNHRALRRYLENS